MQANLDLIIEELISCLKQYGNHENVESFDWGEYQKYFWNKFDNKNTWPIKSIPDCMGQLFSLLKLQDLHDSKES